MSDLERLKERLASGTLLAPGGEMPSIVDLSRALASLAGVEEIAARLGGFLALSDGVDVIEYVWAGGTTRTLSSIAHHSGLTPAEMRVPLLLL